ncbi:MAG: cytochrome c biogenesis protein CcdA [Candidatus Micrarchaeota archaeon]
MAEVTILVALVAGLVSFLSPCVLPLVPAYLTFLAGTAVQKEYSATQRARIFLSSAFFVLGFSLVFSLLGVLLQGILRGAAYGIQTYLGYVGGLMIIVFGLTMTGLIRIEALETERRLRLKPTSVPYLTSFLFGAAFAVGWTPCVGAALGTILTLAATEPASAFPLLLSYSAGLGIPFLLAGLFVSQAAGAIKLIGPYLKWLNVIFGIIIIALGILVFTGSLPLIANLGFLNDFLLQ